MMDKQICNEARAEKARAEEKIRERKRERAIEPNNRAARSR